MSEADAVNGTPADRDAGSIELPEEETYEEGEANEDTLALLKELDESQQEVKRMLEAQRLQAQELGSMKEHLCDELQQLKDDAWRFHMGVELEMLKRQLAILSDLDADLDNMEARLDSEEVNPDDDVFEKLLSDARAETRSILSRLNQPETASGGDTAGPSVSTVGGGEDATGRVPAAGSDEVGDEELEVDEMQDRLDKELETMMAQLQAIKAESAKVSARKAELEAELKKLMEEQTDDLSLQLGDLAVADEEVSLQGDKGRMDISEGAKEESVEDEDEVADALADDSAVVAPLQ